jgi:DNA polymerase type B, organellar and viral
MKPIAVVDLETDPFEYNKMIHPFACGYYDGSHFKPFWSLDCVAEFVTFMAGVNKSYIIYAHNGGRFDFFYFLQYIQTSLRIVNSRIIQAFLGKHELRDSFAIMPFPLETYRKTKIDYNIFTANERDKHRDEIIAYLKDDCVDLHTLCVAFHREFGDNLTIGSAALKQLKKFHKFDSGNQKYDSRLRKDFYFGGRNQCFKTGIIKGPIRVYDVNSMYPHVMKDYLHPVSTGIYKDNKIVDKTSFVRVQGRNWGAFPVRRDDHSLDFTKEHGEFCVTIHEFNAALETGSFQPKKIIETLGFSRRESFDDFVSHFYNARLAAKASDDKIRTIFYKFVLNSSYGKFAQNPENYSEWYITPAGELPPIWHSCSKACDDPCRKKWTPSFMCEDYIIWEKSLVELNFYNVATGASITGASRAVLLRGIRASTDPMYCDTDSIICRNLSGVNLSETKLGGWKLESEGHTAAICGKKLYAVFDHDGLCIKKAHKGSRLTGDEILQIAHGATIESCNPVPAFKFDGSWSFTKRAIKATIQKY